MHASAEDVRIERVAVRGHPRRELIEHSTGAQLVVLGDRGRGSFLGQALLHNAACPAYLARTTS
ncbi:hypothetical protein [Amycolatopsis sp. NPDC021455]|uniref:hypothetical protein n=1 Tax=Amycolatopsis sp. NPDC021455 TaxID=3154901 RepID=UPI0033EAB338